MVVVEIKCISNVINLFFFKNFYVKKLQSLNFSFFSVGNTSKVYNIRIYILALFHEIFKEVKRFKLTMTKYGFNAHYYGYVIIVALIPTLPERYILS